MIYLPSYDVSQNDGTVIDPLKLRVRHGLKELISVRPATPHLHIPCKPRLCSLASPLLHLFACNHIEDITNTFQWC